MSYKWKDWGCNRRFSHYKPTLCPLYKTSWPFQYFNRGSGACFHLIQAGRSECVRRFHPFRLNVFILFFRFFWVWTIFPSSWRDSIEKIKTLKWNSNCTTTTRRIWLQWFNSFSLFYKNVNDYLMTYKILLDSNNSLQ